MEALCLRVAYASIKAILHYRHLARAGEPRFVFEAHHTCLSGFIVFFPDGQRILRICDLGQRESQILEKA